MPLIDCSVDGEPGVKWGESGTCYTYAAGDDEGRKDAVKKAMAQAIAIGDIDTERAITVDELEARAPGDVITRVLPDNYRLALEDDVPEGRACGNCVFYNEAKRDGETVWCERWDDWVRGDYYCNAWQSNEETNTDSRQADAEEGGREATYQESSVETKPTDTLDNERSFSPVAVEFRESGAGTNYKTLIGYPAVFNRMSEDLGGFREVIAPGAFTRALERGDTIKLLYDHDTAAVLASTDNGTLELREDEIGLHMWARVDMADPDVQRVSAKLRSGIVDQMSFAFTMGQAGEEDWDYSGGVPLRTIRAVESLPEVSVVSMPAYLDSKVALLERARLNGRLPELVGAANVAPETVGDESPENTRGTDPKTSAYWRAQLLKRKQEQNRWTS
jgi:HK97 family phage prohead protease